MVKLLIYGASGLAKEVYDIVARSYPDKYEKIYFIDDFVEEASFYLSETIHFDSIQTKFKDEIENLEGIAAVGEPTHREMLTNKFVNVGIRLATVIDKTALISPSASIQDGCIICEYTCVHSDVKVSKGVLLQPFSALGHDTEVGAFSIISSGCFICGNVMIGSRTFIGVNSAIKEKTSIGADVIIAMGSIVFSNIRDGSTVVGNPARITKGNDNHKVF